MFPPLGLLGDTTVSPSKSKKRKVMENHSTFTSANSGAGLGVEAVGFGAPIGVM